LFLGKRVGHGLYLLLRNHERRITAEAAVNDEARAWRAESARHARISETGQAKTAGRRTPG
ncbi:MAG: hypothetical protein ACX94A_08195, partial [Algiphilus sp.]